MELIDNVVYRRNKNFINPIVNKYPIDKVILYGSYARGNANESSDVDLAIDSAGKFIHTL